VFCLRKKEAKNAQKSKASKKTTELPSQEVEKREEEKI